MAWEAYGLEMVQKVPLFKFPTLKYFSKSLLYCSKSLFLPLLQIPALLSRFTTGLTHWLPTEANRQNISFWSFKSYIIKKEEKVFALFLRCQHWLKGIKMTRSTEPDIYPRNFFANLDTSRCWSSGLQLESKPEGEQIFSDVPVTWKVELPPTRLVMRDWGSVSATSAEGHGDRTSFQNAPQQPTSTDMPLILHLS